jgi:superfamily II DNA helicase RecQ
VLLSPIDRIEGREWGHMPAYVILKDAELADIAARDPATLAELAKCRGIGQIRLERWGDEILAVLESARVG